MGAEAIEMYGRAIAMKPRDAGLWRGFATVLERQRQDERALEAWEKVIELSGNDAPQKALRREARSRIIVILHRRPRHAAHRQAQPVAHPVPGDPSRHGVGLPAGGGVPQARPHEEAEKVLTSILNSDPKDMDAKAQARRRLQDAEEVRQAIAILKQLAAEQPALERQYFQEISELELALYHDDEAVAFAQKALEKNPNDAQAQVRLGEIPRQARRHREGGGGVQESDRARHPQRAGAARPRHHLRQRRPPQGSRPALPRYRPHRTDEEACARRRGRR